MKVKELIKELNKFNPNADVLCYTEDEGLFKKDNGFRLLMIDHISKVTATKCRTKENTPSLKFEESSLSEEHVLLNVIADF
ncbi:MAG: hypothetical protein KA270_09745 [Saprospiraceae bacterium]|jgi:hypothetical protein|nr:hypothetical protein [Saprospiraceae bacterium]MBP6238802.1 hypothetical protein [Saprospiraceae bacterium]MBP6567439.1 hypothetical protein [Saprospiraceae bacterium]